MIAVLFFSKPPGGMYEYGKLISEGYKSNNRKALLLSYFGARFDHFLQLIKLILGLKSEVEKWFYINNLHKSDIIHFTDTPLYTVFLINKVYIRNTIYIITIHDPELHPRKGIKDKIRYFMAFLLNTQLLKLSKKRENIHIHLHSKNQTPSEKSNYIFSKHPISNNFSSYKGITKLDEGDLISFLFIGSLQYYKGIDIFIESIKSFKQQHDFKCNFTIAGSGKLNISNDIKKKITVINKFLSDEEFIDLLKKTHIVVFPYRQATQSGVLSQALSLNKPVIISNAGNLPEYIVNRKTGILLENLSAHNLVDTYKEFINSPDLITEMSKNTYKHKEQFYSKETVKILLDQIKSINQ